MLQIKKWKSNDVSKIMSVFKWVCQVNNVFCPWRWQTCKNQWENGIDSWEWLEENILCRCCNEMNSQKDNHKSELGFQKDLVVAISTLKTISINLFERAHVLFSKVKEVIPIYDLHWLLRNKKMKSHNNTHSDTKLQSCLINRKWIKIFYSFSKK